MQKFNYIKMNKFHFMKRLHKKNGKTSRQAVNICKTYN